MLPYFSRVIPPLALVASAFASNTSIPQTSSPIPSNGCFYIIWQTQYIWATTYWSSVTVLESAAVQRPITAIIPGTNYFTDGFQVSTQTFSFTQEWYADVAVRTMATQMVLIDRKSNKTSTSLFMVPEQSSLFDASSSKTLTSSVTLDDRFPGAMRETVLTYPIEIIQQDFAYSSVSGYNGTVPPRYPTVVTQIPPYSTNGIFVALKPYPHYVLRDEIFFRTAFPDLLIKEKCLFPPIQETDWPTTAPRKPGGGGTPQGPLAVRPPNGGYGIGLTVVLTSYVILPEPTAEPGQGIVQIPATDTPNPAAPDPDEGKTVPIQPPGETQINGPSAVPFDPGSGDMESIMNSMLNPDPAKPTPVMPNPPAQIPTPAETTIVTKRPIQTSGPAGTQALPKEFQPIPITGIAVGPEKLIPGGTPITLGTGPAATTLSMNAGGQVVVVASGTTSTAIIPPQKDTFTLAGHIVATSFNNGFAIADASQTLLRGSTITVSGMPIVLQSDCVVIVGSSAVTTLSPGSGQPLAITNRPYNPPSPSTVTPPPNPIDIQTTIITSGSTSITAYIIGSQTLYPGHSITLTSGSSTVVISLTTDASGNKVLVVGSRTTTLPASKTRMMVISPVLVTYISTSIIAGPGSEKWDQRYTSREGNRGGETAAATAKKSGVGRVGVGLVSLLCIILIVGILNV